MDPLQRHRDAVRTRLIQSDRERPGPDSISWRINQEIVVVGGWGRAILLQLAHPSVAAGVHHHSTFRGSLASSLKRVRSTIGAMLSITFGDAEQMINAAAGINAIHDRVRGRVPGDAAQTYSAHDPELQRWVQSTMLDSTLVVYERLVGPLSHRERSRYCAEASIMEPLMGMPAGWLPRDSPDLDTYMREMIDGGTMVVSDTSRALARALLYPPKWRLLWPVFRAMQVLTIGMLPPAIRTAYGFEWTPRDERSLARWTTAVRLMQRVLPAMARQWPIARRTMEGTCRRVGLKPYWR
jgi:uncharacterized protein (DUF2236 family)